jgi:hypothetical protein
VENLHEGCGTYLAGTGDMLLRDLSRCGCLVMWFQSFPGVDDGADGGSQFAHAAVGAAVDGLAFDDAESHLVEVEPAC